jgi:AraC-like DNA-binding protein
MCFLSISENLLKFLSGFGLLQGILLAILFYFHPKADRAITTLLAFYIGCISIPIIIPVGQQLFSWQVIIFVEPFLVLSGPLLYLYVRSYREKITFRKAWPHLAIFPVFVGIAFWLYNIMGNRYPPTVDLPDEVPGHPLSYVPVTVRFIQRFIYYVLAYRVVTSYERSIQHLFSETSRISLRWVKWLVNGYLAILICAIILYSLILKYPGNFSLWVLMIGALVSVYIYMAAWKGVSQSTIWQVQPEMNKEKVEEVIKEAEKLDSHRGSNEKTRSRRTGGLTDAKIEEIVGKINAVMEQEKLYQEPELTLQQLANRLELPTYQLSQAINEGMNKNFYDLINSYRVEEAKRLLLADKNQKYTILSVGFEAGFNSKTTFNTVFKKFTGLTPTDFREKENATMMVA